MRAALYARTSTSEQNPLSQILSMRDYCAARGWPVELEYIDDGISGAADQRPALRSLTRDARRGRFEVVVAWRLDRLGRSLRSLVLLLDDFRDAGIAFASVQDGIDLSTAGGRFMAQLLGAFAEYERTVIADRVRMGLDRARREGTRLGRPRTRAIRELAHVADLSLEAAAEHLRVSRATIARWRREARTSA
jgi:DNA invertase Pin-like site-specific DNA recombinase